MTGNLLTTAELAKRLSLAPATLRHWRLEGRGPRAIKIGRSVRYDLEDVEAWIEEHREGAEAVGT